MKQLQWENKKPWMNNIKKLSVKILIWILFRISKNNRSLVDNWIQLIKSWWFHSSFGANDGWFYGLKYLVIK